MAAFQRFFKIGCRSYPKPSLRRHPLSGAALQGEDGPKLIAASKRLELQLDANSGRRQRQRRLQRLIGGFQATR